MVCAQMIDMVDKFSFGCCHFGALYFFLVIILLNSYSSSQAFVIGSCKFSKMLRVG